jgi:hypothetical protein
MAVFALIFGGSIVSVAPANAASINGCVSSNWQPSSCGGTGAVAVLNVTPDLVGVVGTAVSKAAPTVSGSCPSPTFQLFTAADSSYATPISNVATGIVFATNGTFSGTPTVTLASTGYRIVASCATSPVTLERFSLTITVTATATPTLTPATQTVSGVVNSAITSTTAYTRINFTPNDGTFAVTGANTLPAGLTLNTATGVVSGTPTATSSVSVTIRATNTAGTPQTADATITFSITASAPASISPSSQTLTATQNQAMTNSAAFTASNFGACTPIVYSSTTLPAGLSINTGTGVISGTPTATGTTQVTVTATCNTDTPTATVDITVSAVAVSNSVELDRKVTICHRTHSETNPYVRITVDYNSVNKKSGHQGHDEIFAGEHVFKAGIYKRAKDKDWGDIIPADPTGFGRWQPLNWTTLGAQIYNGTVAGCPAYDAVKYYNALREAGVPEKQIKKEIAELETEQAEAKPEVKKTNITELKYTGTDKKALEGDNDKVTICHRTNSVTNPYVRITVAASSIYKTKGHYGHDEIYDGNHVFDSSVDYPANRKDWGDIIPADPTGKNRWTPLNMTTLGKKIYEGTVAGCAEKTAQQLYNELREEGKSKKEIMKDLEEQKSLDEDPKELDELEYTGSDPKVEKTEPKEPVDPSDPTNLTPVKIPDQSLSGIVWLDINRDGLKDPDEPFMKNIKLYVVQLTSTPAPVTPASVYSPSALRRADAPVRSAAVKEVLTDENGFYLFPSLGAGDWKVTTTVPDNLVVTYDSYTTSDGEITTTVPVASHAFTWVGLVGTDEKVTLAKLTEILKENPNALPESELPAALKVLVKKAKAALAGKTSLAETGTQDLAWFYFGILLMLTGVALRFARTKQ